MLLASCTTAPSSAPKPAAATAATNLVPVAPASTAMASLPASFSGAWFVSGVFPGGSGKGSAGDHHLGVAVHLSDSEASDINGQRCFHPTFASDQVSGNAAGLKMIITGDVTRLQVTCDGKPFAVLLQAPGKALPGTNAAGGTALMDGDAPVLMALRPEGVYLLERAEQVLYRQAAIAAPAAAPAPVDSNEPAATPAGEAKYVDPKASEHVLVAPSEDAVVAPKPVKPVAKSSKATSQEPKMKSMTATAEAASGTAKKPVQKAAAQTEKAKTVTVAAKASPEKAVSAKATTIAPKPGTAIHLASYNAVPAAVHGWELLHGEYSELAPLKPLYVSVEIGGKAMIRLFATGASDAKLKQICGALQAKQAYCALHP
jgi:hypothetical protein